MMYPVIELNLRKAYHQSNQTGCFGFLKPKEGIRVRDYLFEREVMDLLGNPHRSRLAHIILNNPTLVLGFITEPDTKRDHFHPKGKPAGSNRPAIIDDIEGAVETLGRYQVLQYLEENCSRFRYAKGLVRSYAKSEAWKTHEETNGLVTFAELVKKTGLTREAITKLLFERRLKKRIKWTAPPEYEKEFGDEGMLYAFFERQDPDGPSESEAKLMTTEAHGFVRAVEYTEGEEAKQRPKSIPQIVEGALHLLYFDPEGVYYYTPEAIHGRKLSTRLEMGLYWMIICLSLSAISAAALSKWFPEIWKSTRGQVQRVLENGSELLPEPNKPEGK